MPKETEEARDERKRKFIAALKESKCRELIEPLRQKIASYIEGSIAAEDVFKAVHYVSRESNEVIALFKKRPDVILAGIAMEANLYVTEIGGINVKARKGDLTVLFVDAIVNPESPDGKMTAGVAGAIKKEGGAGIEEEARSKAPIKPGSAVVTAAGSLPNLHVVHAPTAKEPGGASSAEQVKAAVAAALRAAETAGAESIAIPGMGTGAGGVPPDDAAWAAVDAIRSHEAKSISDVILIDRGEETALAFTRALERFDEENG
jgi:O-acetyl-ADP-ribose deacetylase (regulator of RNase III)